MTDNADQIAEWNGPLGDAWAQFQAKFDAILMGPFGDEALKAAAAKPGERVLDVGCGSGTTSLGLAEVVGPAGSVLGVDISKPMLELARRRSKDVANLAFEEADASTAALPSGVDLLFSRFGVMFFADPTAAFSHLHGALKPGARLAFCCWRGPKENPWAATPMGAIRTALEVTDPPPPPEAPGPFAFADPERLRGILTDAGFSQIDIRPFEAPIHWGASANDAALNASRMGPGSQLLHKVAEDARAKAVAALEAAFAPLAKPDGAVALTGAVWIVTANA